MNRYARAPARALACSEFADFARAHTHEVHTNNTRDTQTHTNKHTHINTHTHKHRIAMHIVGKYRLGNAKETEVTACWAFCWTAVSAVCGLKLLVYEALSY